MFKARPIVSINVTPLADVTTTLIVIFLITMPYIMWSGIKVNSTRAVKDRKIVQAEKEPEPIVLVLTTKEVYLNKERVKSRRDLELLLRGFLKNRPDKQVIIVPDGDVLLGRVVEVLDIAKQSGAVKLALLKRKEGRLALSQ